jgi:hypothetical protein
VTTESSTRRLETLLAEGNGGDEIRLPRKEAHELAQKLRARGATSGARLESLLGRSTGPDVAIPRAQALALVDELRESGRKWVFGSGAVAQPPVAEAAPAAPVATTSEPEPEDDAAALVATADSAASLVEKREETVISGSQSPGPEPSAAEEPVTDAQPSSEEEPSPTIDERPDTADALPDRALAEPVAKHRGWFSRLFSRE